MKQTIEKIPDTIFLQLHGDRECVDNIEEISLEDVTWAKERIYPSDVEYTRRKSPWIKVGDREHPMQKGKGYLLLLEDGSVVNYDSDWEDRCLLVIAYMPIPSFDEILESNKDVLKRIKEKGD